jgi:1,4-dihydroxy-2-naphthoate octaprenyltransferase
LLAATAGAALVAEILHANNMRDIEPDRRAGKVTLATLLGRRGSAHEYLLLVVVAYAAIVAMVIGDPALWPALIVFATLPTTVALVRIAYEASEPMALNRLLRRTAGLHLRFGALLTGGLLVRVIIDRLS